MSNNIHQTRTTTYYLVLEDGTIVSSRWHKNPGDSHIKPGTRESVNVKYVLTKVEYAQCLENRKDLVKRYEVAKAIRIRERTGWSMDVKMQVLKDLYTSVMEEPLMKETFFTSMAHFV